MENIMFFFKGVKNCANVFVRNEKVRALFSAPYEGHFKVVENHEKYFTVL